MEYGDGTEIQEAKCAEDVWAEDNAYYGQKANRRELEEIGRVGRCINREEKEGKHRGFQEEMTQHPMKFSELLKA